MNRYKKEKFLELLITQYFLKHLLHVGRKLLHGLGRAELCFDCFDGAHDSTLITKEKAVASDLFYVLSMPLFFLPALQSVHQGR